MHKTLLFIGVILTLLFQSCEKEDITSIDDIVGTWTSDLSEVRVVKNGEEAWIEYINVEKENTYGMNTGFSCGGCNIVVHDYSFSYSSGDNSASGEFKSPSKLVLKGKVDGSSVRYVLSK
jgi:hypothetical protein